MPYNPVTMHKNKKDWINTVEYNSINQFEKKLQFNIYHIIDLYQELLKIPSFNEYALNINLKQLKDLNKF